MMPALWHRSMHTGGNIVRRHIMAALVVNQPGCLAQIANLFSARGYNIDSLVVGRTEIPELSRMTVVVNGTAENVANMKKQLEDVVQVARVNILTDLNTGDISPCVERDLMMVKVSTTDTASRSQVLELANLFEAKVLDVRLEQLMLQLAGTPERIEALIEMLRPIGIVEIHRSGVIAMAKGSSVGDDIDESSLQGATSEIMQDIGIDDTNLPPG